MGLAPGEIDREAHRKVVVSHIANKPFVMDMSFLEISHLRELAPKLHLVHPPKALADGSPSPKKGRRRLKCASVRLANNAIESICGPAAPGDEFAALAHLGPALDEVVADLPALRWIDLSRAPASWSLRRALSRKGYLGRVETDLSSTPVEESSPLLEEPFEPRRRRFNRVSKIGDAFAGLNLHVLYLHANAISSFGEVKPLGELKELRSLTLHGNPIEDKKHYRTYVIHLCQSLNQLDFSTITRQDRETAAAWAFTFRKKLAGGSCDDDE